MALRVHLRRLVGSKVVDPVGMKRFVRTVLRGEGFGEGAVTVVLADDATLRDLNARFRHRDRVTDVLSFPLGEEDEGGGTYLGDVVVSLERARSQAPRFGNDVETELARLVAHGLLHLLGYDHHRPADGRRMKAAERRALAALEAGSLLRAEGGNLT